MPSDQGKLIVYQGDDGRMAVDVRLEDETVWLMLNQMAELFERDKSVISRHLRNIYQSGELVREATVAKHATVQKEGNREVTRQIESRGENHGSLTGQSVRPFARLIKAWSKVQKASWRMLAIRWIASAKSSPCL